MANTQYKFSLVTVSYGSPHILFESLRKTTSTLSDSPFKICCELIVVDNYSGSENRRLFLEGIWKFEHSFERLSVVTNSANIGFGAACNIGADRSHSDFLFFLNPDAWIASTAGIDKFFQLMGSPMCGAVSPSCFLSTGEQAQIPRFKLTPAFYFLSNFKLGKYRNNPYVHLLLPVLSKRIRSFKSVSDYMSSFEPLNKHQRVSVVGGSALCISRQAHDAINGFDENFFLYEEDYDYCIRLLSKGFINYASNYMSVHMMISGTQHKVSSRTMMSIKYRSRALFVKKHFRGWRKWLLLIQLHALQRLKK